MKQDIIKYERRGHVALISINRPESRNAQSRILLESLDDAFRSAAEDTAIRVIVLTGEGDHFSAGHDLGSPQELDDRQRRPMQEGLRGRFDHSREQYVEKSMRWRNIRKPTIAAIKGYCIFGGWIIASAMDIIFAGRSSMFLAANFQFFTVPWDIHPRKAKELLYESRFIDAGEAKQLGLVNRIFQDDQLMNETMTYADRIARNDPFQLQMMKLAVNQMQDVQGFGPHMTTAHLMHMMSTEGEKDLDYALPKPDKRRPMVERAFENYRQHKAREANHTPRSTP